MNDPSSASHAAQDRPSSKPLIGVVGPCGSGKSTLIDKLETHGYPCRHIAQEHSYVKDMWQRISHPEVLIFLGASFPVSTARRNLKWLKSDHEEQERRLSHARQHADLFVNTDSLTPEQVLEIVLTFLQEHYP